MNRRPMLAMVPLLALAIALPALGHHGWGSYDADRLQDFEATLVTVAYRNPHAEVEVDRDGERWLVILAPTSRMDARGLPPGALVEGRSIGIQAYPRSDGTRELRAERIVVDGRTIELR
jgi:hypothetical protein